MVLSAMGKDQSEPLSKIARLQTMCGQVDRNSTICDAVLLAKGFGAPHYSESDSDDSDSDSDDDSYENQSS